MASVSVIPLGMFLVQVFLMASVLRAGLRSRLNRGYALYVTALMISSIGMFLTGLVSDLTLAKSCLQLKAAGQLAVPLTLLFFSQAFLHSRERSGWLAVGCSLLVLSLAALGSGLVIYDVRVVGASITYRLGPTALIILAYSMAYVGVAVLDLFIRHREVQDPVQSRQLVLIMAGTLIASLAGLINLLPILRPYPIALILQTSNAFLIYTLFYHRHRGLTAALRILISRALIAWIISVVIWLCLLLAAALAGSPLRFGIYLVSFALALAITGLLRLTNDGLQDLVDRMLFREHFKARQQLTVLGRTATSSLDLDLLTHLMLDQASEALGITRSCLMLRDDPSGDYVIVSHRGLDAAASHIRLRGDHEVVSWLADMLQPLTRRHLYTLPQFRGMWNRERTELDLLAGELYVPLNVNAELVGILVVGPKASPEPYAERDQDTLTMLANQTAAAVANARLLSEAHRHVSELTTLQEMSMKLSFSLDMMTVIDQVTESALKLGGVRYARLFLWDQTRVAPPITRLAPSEAGMVDPPPEPDALLQTIAEQGQITLISNTKTHPLYATSEYPPCAIAGLPLKRVGQTLGVLVVAFAAPQPLNERELSVLSLLADQAAMAIENARLYQESLEQKRRIEVILSQTFSGIMVVDPDFRITVFNPALETITGLRADQAIGQPLPDVLDESLWGKDSLLQVAAANRSRVDPQETSLASPRGLRDVLEGITPLFDNQERIIGYLMSFADITHLKEVDRLKSDIVANVSHELRAPLASIKAYTELLLDGMEGNDIDLRRQFLSIIDQETNRLSNLITDLLDLARLESGRFEVRKLSVRVGDLCMQAVELFGLQIRQKRLKIEMELPDQDLEIFADRDMLFIIIKNLVSNAVKFSQSGGHIRISSAFSDSDFVLTVSDDGVGIPQEALPHLFQKFYRVRSTTESGIEGTGLGLALAKQATEAHGGTIEAHSGKGRGATFVVRLPLQ